MRGMVLTAEQMRQVRMNKSPLSWAEQKVLFSWNWQVVTINSLDIKREAVSSNEHAAAGVRIIN